MSTTNKSAGKVLSVLFALRGHTLLVLAISSFLKA